MIKRKRPSKIKRMLIGIRAFWIGFIIYPIAAFVIAIESLFSKKRDE